MARYYVEPHYFTEDSVTITGDDVKHIRNVLRGSVGDKLTICDCCGTVYDTKISSIDTEIVCKILDKKLDENEPDVRLTIVQAIPKGDKIESIIQKCVELGASRIIPVYSEFTVVKSDPKGDANKLVRWQRIAREAAKQCCRGIIPIVDAPTKLKNVAKPEDDEVGLMAWERGMGDPRDIIQSCGNKVRILVGSEGGFSTQEAQWAQDNGYTLISMGPRILRSETAGPALSAAIMFATGNWNNRQER